MESLLQQQLSLYPAIALPSGQQLNGTLVNDISLIQLHSAGRILHQWSAPIHWGQVLDYLLNQQESNDVLANISLSANIIFDPQRSILQRGDEITRLTDKEQATLLYLYHAGRPVSREELVEKVWGYHADVQTHTVETLIWRLRQKLETNPEMPAVLTTTPQGYTLNIS